MDPPISNQLQEPGDEEDDNNCRTNNNAVAIQEPARDSLFDYVAATNDQDHDLLQEKSLEYYSKWCELVSSCTAVSTAPSPRKAFNVASSSQKLKAAKARRKAAEIVEVHGGRILRTPGRKDRHSKVCTARGARDRRVRLSPKTAIEFYDVQDRLGYDRPSKAIDWLMKEAKAAIDALDEPPPLAAAAATDHIQFKAQHQQMHEDSYTNHVPSFGFFTNGIALLPSSELHGCITDNDCSTRRSEAHQDSINVLPSYHQEGPSLSALISTTTHPEMYDANLEMARLQRVFAYASAGSVDPAHFPGHSNNSHNNMFSQREPLQSSHVTYNYSPFTSNQCNPGISFSSHDFPNVAAAEDQRDNKVPVSINPASFLQYEG